MSILEINDVLLSFKQHTSPIAQRSMTFSLALIAGIGLLSTGRFAIPEESDPQLREALQLLVAGLAFGFADIFTSLYSSHPVYVNNIRDGRSGLRESVQLIFADLIDVGAMVGFLYGSYKYILLLFKVI